MEILQHLKSEINEAVDQSILLRDDMRAAIKAKAALTQDVDALRNVLNMLLREKDYIIKYLQEVIKIDTTGLTAYKLRELMQKSYLKTLQGQEAQASASEKVEAEASVAKISF